MPSDPDGPRSWKCEHCENVLGVMHRNSNKVMVLDVFRGPVSEAEFVLVVNTATHREYSVLDLGYGKVVCICGRLHTWDASEQLMKDLLRRRKNRSIGG